MNLLHLFDLSLASRRDAMALDFLACDGRRESRTFGEIEDASNRIARVLAARGFTKGDRLCVHLPNCVEFIELFLACVKLGVIFVPINILYRDREIEHIVRDAEPKAVMGPGELPELVRTAASDNGDAASGFCGGWRCARRDCVHLRHHRRFQGRCTHAQ